MSSTGQLPVAPPLNTTNWDCMPPGPVLVPVLVLVLVWRVRGEGVGPLDGTATHWPDSAQKEGEPANAIADSWCGLFGPRQCSVAPGVDQQLLQCR